MHSNVIGIEYLNRQELKKKDSDIAELSDVVKDIKNKLYALIIKSNLNLCTHKELIEEVQKIHSSI